MDSPRKAEIEGDNIAPNERFTWRIGLDNLHMTFNNHRANVSDCIGEHFGESDLIRNGVGGAGLEGERDEIPR